MKLRRGSHPITHSSIRNLRKFRPSPTKKLRLQKKRTNVFCHHRNRCVQQQQQQQQQQTQKQTEANEYLITVPVYPHLKHGSDNKD
jgi:predicted Zn-dependent protease